MNLDDVITNVVKRRSTLFSSLPRAYNGFDKRHLFNVFSAAFDSLINDPLVDTEGVTLDGYEKNIPVDEDGRFVTPADTFTVHGVTRNDGVHVFTVFNRLLEGSYAGLYGEPGDTLYCTAFCADPDFKEVFPLIPMVMLSEKAPDETGYGITLGIPGYSGEAESLITPGVSSAICSSLGIALLRAKNDKSCVKVPAIRRTLNEVAKRKLHG